MDLLFSAGGEARYANVGNPAEKVKLNIQKLYGNFFIILQRMDTGEYLRKFEFFNPDPPQWSTDPNDTLKFIGYDIAESNFRLIIERMGDPLNNSVRIMMCNVTVNGDELIVKAPESLSVVRVA
jgi:hypothetical protein